LNSGVVGQSRPNSRSRYCTSWSDLCRNRRIDFRFATARVSELPGPERQQKLLATELQRPGTSSPLLVDVIFRQLILVVFQTWCSMLWMPARPSPRAAVANSQMCECFVFINADFTRVAYWLTTVCLQLTFCNSAQFSYHSVVTNNLDEFNQFRFQPVQMLPRS
jgi:hypothetical protein